MPDLHQIILSAAVEGSLDEIALRRLLAEANLLIGKVYGKAGKDYLRNRIQDYNNAARFTPWVVLVDLDREADCAGSLCRSWSLEPVPKLMLRVAVRAMAASSLPDTATTSDDLAVSQYRAPITPDDEPDPRR